MTKLSIDPYIFPLGISDHKKVMVAMQVEADMVVQVTILELFDETIDSTGVLIRMDLEDLVAVRLV